jgi:hypothetical protein
MTVVCIRTSLESVCVHSRKKTLARDRRRSTVVELRRMPPWPRLRFRGGSRVTKLCGTLHVVVGTAANNSCSLCRQTSCSLTASGQRHGSFAGLCSDGSPSPPGTIPCGMHQPPPRCRYWIQEAASRLRLCSIHSPLPDVWTGSSP